MIMINWPSKCLVLARCVVFIRFDYTLIAEDSLWFLFWSQKKRVKERKEKKKKRKQKMLEWYIFLVQAVDLKPQKTEEVACVAGPRKNGRARGRHARGEGGPARKAHENRFNSHSVSADISNWSRGSREENYRAGRENCQSIVHGQRSDGLILRHQLLKPLNGIIEVQVSEVTSAWFNGTMWLSSTGKVEMFIRYSRRKEPTSDMH